MATLEDKRRGITGPLSEAMPTAEENQMTDSLKEELRRQNNYESAEDTKKRHVILDSLKSIAKMFVKEVTQAQGKLKHEVDAANAAVLTFGSFRLGVFGPGSDIDTLIVGPKNVNRTDFFDRFPTLLLKHTPKGAISGLTCIPGARVPLIGFEYSGVTIDLIYSHIEVLSIIPDNLSLLDDSLLQRLEQADLDSLNGNRVTDEILELVPQPAVFKTALRAVKLWAQRRGIYANIVGFCGGVAWAMLLARVCQLFPKATASTMVSKFFRVIENWNWPMPVLLKPLDSRNDLNLRVWNPKLYKKDGFHLMPIITPSYPQICSTNTVTYSTLEVMRRELKRGREITEKIMIGKAPWKDLFVKNTFFTEDYKHYLVVTSSSLTKEAQQIWSGRVESRVRLLIEELENHPSIALAHPFNKTFSRVHRCRTDQEVEKAKSGSIEYVYKEIPTEANDLKNRSNGGIAVVNEDDFEGAKNSSGEPTATPDIIQEDKSNKDETFTFVYSTTSYIGLELKEGAKSLDLLKTVNEWKHRDNPKTPGVTNWELYDPELNDVSVNATRNFDLPDDVFGEGEVKPTRPAKKSKKRVPPAKSSEPEPLKKRSAPEGSSETQTASAKRQQTSVAAAG